MVHKYSFYQLRIACQQHMIASLYVEPDDPDAFHVGYVEAVTTRHVLLWNVTPWGQPDGWLLRRTKDVLQVFMGDDFEVRLQMLLEMQGVTHTPLLAPAPSDDDDLLRIVLDHCRETSAMTSVVAGSDEETYTGRIVQVDDLRMTMDALDFFGSPDGKQQFALRDLSLVELETNEELMYRRLGEAQLKLL